MAPPRRDPNGASSIAEDVWKNWSKSGKNEFMNQIKQRLPEAGKLWKGKSQEEVREMLYELTWKYLRNVIQRDQVVNTLGELCVSHLELSNLIPDVLWAIDVETQVEAETKKDQRNRFIGMLKDCLPFVSEGILKERLDIDTLGEIGVIKHPKKFGSGLIKMKTRLFYKQQKFNLIREANEGFSKVIVQLYREVHNSEVKETLDNLKSLIGHFSLCPNRVLDLILEAFENQLERRSFFVELIKDYMPQEEKIVSLISFKLDNYNSEECENPVPQSLFIMVAYLIQAKIISFHSVYGLLTPSDEDIKGAYEKDKAEVKTYIRSLAVVALKQKDGNEEEKMEVDEEDKTYSRHFKFRLLEAMFSIGAWDDAELLLSKFPAYFAVGQRNVASALQRLIHITIEPLYKKVCYPQISKRSKIYEPLDNELAPKPISSDEEFAEVVVPMLLSLGPFAYTDTVLLYKVLRILKASLGVTLDESGRDREKLPPPVSQESTCLWDDIISLIDEVFLPSLTLSESNSALSEEIWSILRCYSYDVRYTLYDQWKTETYLMHPELMKRKAFMQRSIKRIMQRISKENVKPTSRQLGSLTHSSPGLIFDYILSQLQMYDNMIGPVVDSLKFLTSLSYDVLGYAIIEALSDPGKDRTKHDGTSISLWLQSLSNFCGSVYKKYNIELTSLLQYVSNQLLREKSLDLLIIKEIVLKMAGIEAAEDMTNEQIEAMSGGDILRQEAGSFTQIKNTRKSSQRLKETLMESQLAVPLCLLMAQQRQCVIFKETQDSHLKLVGKLFDQCQDTLVQFGTFLASSLSVDDYTHTFPPMDELLSKYHVHFDLAFFIERPMFNHQIALKYEEMRRQDRNSWKTKTGEERQAKYVEASNAVMTPVMEAIKPLQPDKVWDDISPQFLTTFWSLTMYDLNVPDEIYSKEIGKLKAMPAKIDENRDLNATRKKREKERVNNLLEKLVDEQKRQREHVDRVMARLKQEKDSWFFSRSAKLAKNETITTFLQLCLFPRCIFTAIDAIYCAKFVHIIHMLKTPNFSTLICFDRIFCDITYTVTQCTENEAHRYGRFLAAMLEIAMKWHSSKEVFEMECVGYPGFVTKFRVADKNASSNGPQQASSGDDHVDYENYRHVCHKWHYKLAKALVVCLESKDYVQIRNALTVLFKILPYFPIIVNLSIVIEKRIEKVCTEEKEERKDLYVMATSYMGQLKARKPNMIKETDFHLTKKGSSSSNASSPTPKASDSDSSRAVSENREKSAQRSLSKEKSVDRKASEKRSDDRSKSEDRKTSDKKSSAREKSKERDRSSSRDIASTKERNREERAGSSSRRDKDKDRENHRERSKERDRDRGREKDRDNDGELMGPPSKTSHSSARSSKEPSEERESKRRKIDGSSSSKERHKR